MKSPFPGMDPYLEARWSNVHTTLIVAIQEALQPELPVGLRARAEERVLLEAADDGEPHLYRSDVAVIECGKAGPKPTAIGSVATVEPVYIAFHEEMEPARWVQVIDTTDGNRVITAIEVLSPGNKAPGRLNAAYWRKLRDYQRGSVSVVEIDLLRYPSRARLPVRTDDLPLPRRTPYLVCVRKAWEPDRWAAYPLALRARLPHVPIPLRPTDVDVGLDLQRLIDHVYEAGGHDDLDYNRPAEPPLSTEDAAWSRQLTSGR